MSTGMEKFFKKTRSQSYCFIKHGGQWMKIDTTVYMKRVVLERIDSSAKKFSISRSKLVSLLLIRMMQGKNTDKNRFSRVKYQKRDKNGDWKRPHVMFEPDLYEKNIDMRKLHKKSVSYIVTVAYKRYFDSVIEELNDGGFTDNYLKHYICIGKRIGSVFSYTVFWEYPPEKYLYQHLE